MKRVRYIAILAVAGLPVAYSGANPPSLPPARTEGTGELERLLTSCPVLNQSLTVEQAVVVALRESPAIRGAVAEVDAAEGRLKAARAETRPTVSANTFVSGGSLPNIVESPELPGSPRMIMGLPRGGYVDQNVMVMYPLFTSGRLQAMTRQANALRGASGASLEAQRQEVALMVRVAYREVQARQSLIAVGKARLQENEERLRVDRERLVQAQIPAYYVKRDEAETASARQEVTNAERDASLAVSQLKTLMGISLASHLVLVDKLQYTPSAELIRQLIDKGNQGIHSTAAPASTSPSTLGMPPDLMALLRRAEQNRAELRAAGERIAGAQAGETAQGAAFHPQANVFAMGDVLKSDGMRRGGGVTYGLTASFPLYTGGAKAAQAQIASAERRQQEAERERVALQIAKEVNDAYVRLTAAEQNIQTANAAQEAAQEAYRAAKARFDAGRSIMTEVLDALATRVRAESETVQALYNYNIAHDQLLRAVGASNGLRG